MISHGRSAKTYIQGVDMTGYLNSVTISPKADVAETSVFAVSSKQFIAGLKDATLSIKGFYDGATGADVDVINAALAASSNQIFMYFPQGDTLGLDGWGFAAIGNSFAINSDLSGAVGISGDAQSSVGAELGVSLHALGIESATVNSASVNQAAATTNGGSAYLMVTAFVVPTTATVKVQDSANDSTFADIATFTAVTVAPASQRVAIAGTIRQYVRSALTTLTGTSITYAVLLHRD